jgi:hypothetical protein
VDYTAGTTVANATVVGIGDSCLDVYNGGVAGVDVIVDGIGYFVKSGTFNGFAPLITPTRRTSPTRTA